MGRKRTRKPNLEEYPYAFISVGNDPPFDCSDENKPFKVRLFPRNTHFSDDSDSDSGNEFAKEKKEKPEILKDKIPKPHLEEYPFAFISVGNEPPFDYNDKDKPFKVRLFPRNTHLSDDSSTDSSYFSDSGENIGEEELEINKENSRKDREIQLEFPPKASQQEDQTPAEPIEERLDLDFDPDSKNQAIQFPKASTAELLSGPTVPTSSILVKHGTKRPAEAEAGDEDFKRANKMPMPNSTDDENKQN